jgi:hypothetical protein
MEGHEFAVQLSIASRREQLLELLVQEPTYQKLRGAIRADDHTARAVLQRIATLSAIEFDRDYQNPYDIALVGYVWAFFETRGRYPFYLQLALDFASQAPDTWWMPRLLAGIRNESKAGHANVTCGGERRSPQHQSGVVKATLRYRASMIAVPASTRNRLSKNLQTTASFGSRISTANSVGTSMVA